MQALQIYAGAGALAHLREHGLRPEHVALIPGAAGGPKGLILNALDQFIFGDWLTQSSHTVHLVGASIGAWRMSTAMMSSPRAALQKFGADYISQEYDFEPGKKLPSADHVSEKFAGTIHALFHAQVGEILQHPRYRLHIVTSRGRHVLARESKWRTPLGYLGAYATNMVQRRAMGAWLERVIFSDRRDGLPLKLNDYRTRVMHLNERNFEPALLASCSIPFALRAVQDIPGAPRGAYWDGGITDYHLHWNYASLQASTDGSGASLALYPHFQQQVVPGWLDKSLKWRHGSTAFLDKLIVLAPSPEWVKTLPNRKLPDRQDFAHFGRDIQSRMKVWGECLKRSEALAHEFEKALQTQDWSFVKPL